MSHLRPLNSSTVRWVSGEVPRSPSSPTPSSVWTEALRLEELRRVAIEERVEAKLSLGRHAELVGELKGSPWPTRWPSVLAAC